MLEKRCAGASIAITGGNGARTLVVTTASGAQRRLSNPGEMSGYVPRGLGCATSEAGVAHGFIVEYGEEPYGCEFCEWRYLVDAEGAFLTRAEPAILTDPTRPEGARQYANQREYSRESDRLSLRHEELDYVPEQGGS